MSEKSDVKSDSDYGYIVTKYRLQNTARKLLPNERVALCLRRRQSLKENVEVRYTEADQRAYYANLTVCGSVWHCPICGSKITSRRRDALTRALEHCKFEAVLITYTLSHHMGDRLTDLLHALKESLRKMKSGRDFQYIKEDYAWLGSFVTTEVTHGENGWHPHLHELALLREPTTPITRFGLSRHFKREWQEKLEQLGYSADWQHGVDVQHSTDFDKPNGDIVGKYITKSSQWSLEAEMTKSHVKRGRGSNRGMMQLLESAADGNRVDGSLWQEYAIAFKGRSHLHASRGLKKLLGFVDKSDKEIAREDDQNAEFRVLAALSDYQWHLVKRNDARGHLIALAQTRDTIKINQFLENLR